MDATQRFDPFKKVSGESAISTVLNAILAFAFLFQKEGLSINNRRKFIKNHSKAVADFKNHVRPPSIHIHVENTRGDDLAEPGRKIKGHMAGSSNRRNMNKKKSKKKKKNSKKRKRSKRNSDVISDVERERRLRQSEADKEKFARLQQQILEEKQKPKTDDEEKKKERAQEQRKKASEKKKQKYSSATARAALQGASSATPPPATPSSSSSSASNATSSATANQVASASTSSPPSYAQVASKGATSSSPSAFEGASPAPLLHPTASPSAKKYGILSFTSSHATALRVRPVYPGVMSQKQVERAIMPTYLHFDRMNYMSFILPDGRCWPIRFYRIPQEQGPWLWLHDYDPTSPDKRTVTVINEPSW